MSKTTLAILNRLVYLGFVVLGMSVLMFFISHALPGDPARVAAGGERATAEMIAEARRRLALDKPVYVQYWRYMQQLLKGGFGRSIVTNRPVIDDLTRLLPASLELTLSALLFASLVGIPMGVMASKRPNSLADNGLRVFSSFFISMPDFWMGLLLVLFFYRLLGILPFTGRLSFSIIPPPTITGFMTFDSLLSGNWDTLADSVVHLILPTVTLGFVSIGFFSRMTRSSMVEVLTSHYIRTAYGKGLKSWRVFYLHALRNAWIPIMTIMGLQLGNIVGGAVVIETIFSWPGIGKYAVEAVENQDFPAIMGFAIIYSLFYALVNLVVDLLALVADPRLKRAYTE